jgi:hypothetical protein
MAMAEKPVNVPTSTACRALVRRTSIVSSCASSAPICMPDGEPSSVVRATSAVWTESRAVLWFTT